MALDMSGYGKKPPKKKVKLAEDDPGWLKAHGIGERQARTNRLNRYGRNKPDGNGQYRPT